MRNPRHLVPAVAVVGLLVLAGCSGGDARSLGPVPTAPPTSVEETTTTVPVTTSTTVAGVTTTPPPTTAAPTPTTKPPVVVEGVPQVAATPSRGPTGTRVRVEGTGFTDPTWKVSGGNLWLAGTGGPGCSLYADVQHTIAVSAAGRLTGEFVVPATGNCRMSDIGNAPVVAGTYRLAFTCTACFIGRFEVTSSATTCAVVGFTPNSDDVASSIVPTNMGCAEAEALIRKVDPLYRSVAGGVRAEADGFVCVRTGENDTNPGLAYSDFECTSGVKKVTYRRT